MPTKIDKQFIVKNIIGIFSLGLIVLLLFPMSTITMTADVVYTTVENSTTFMGYNYLGVGFGFVMLLCPAIILIANYVQQLEAFKKLITFLASIAHLIGIFLIPFENAVTDYTQVTTDVEFGFIFTVMGSIALITLSAIQFFGLNVNKETLTEFTKSHDLSALK